MGTVREGERIVDGEPAVHVLGSGAHVERAVTLLDTAERAAGAPLVDEAERRRLQRLEESASVEIPHWHPLLATSGGKARGYGGIVVDDEHARADLAVDRSAAATTATTRALLTALARVARDHGAGRLEVWMRHATRQDDATAKACGYDVARRLHVLGRDLRDPLEQPDLPSGVEIRAFRPEQDVADVVAVLARAYEGTPDGGWDPERFDKRTSYGWFDPADLLVADDGGKIVGIHWTKRRGDGVGEVYNLAVDPDAQGRGLGRALLLAGLSHLRTRDCRRVILWVDEDNAAGLALYAAAGFEREWMDTAFACTL